jgi:RNA-directed DNA polymerase
MTKSLVNLQDLRRRIFAKAKAEKQWRFWGLYVHVCKMETLRAAYRLAKKNNGAPGLDGATFAQIENEVGADNFLKQIQHELLSRTYRPMRNRKKEIPKGNGKVRVLGIPSIRDRVVQGALKLILEPIFEADFQEGSFGYRPNRSAHDAIARVAEAIVKRKTRVIDVDLKAYFDNVSHSILLAKIAQRVRDPEILRLCKMILKASGKKGVPQGGVISPLYSNIYLNEVDRMLEKAQQVTRTGKYTNLNYARYADDLVILVDAHPSHDWLVKAAERRLREELAKIQVEVNDEKSRTVDLAKGESFGFLGFEFRRVKSLRGNWRPQYTPQVKKRTALLQKLRKVFEGLRSQSVRRVIRIVNPIVGGWVRYFRVGHSNRSFSYVQFWIEKKVRRHLAKARDLPSFGWDRWSTDFIYGELGLFSDYKVRYMNVRKALP